MSARDGRRTPAKKGSGGEIKRYLEEHPERKEAAISVLRYTGPMNFAPWVRCPTLVGVADEVVPAPTLRAIADHLAGPYEIVTWATSHTDLPEEDFFRERFEARMLRLALDGIPKDFGERDPGVARGQRR